MHDTMEQNGHPSLIPHCTPNVKSLATFKRMGLWERFGNEKGKWAIVLHSVIVNAMSLIMLIIIIYYCYYYYYW